MPLLRLAVFDIDGTLTQTTLVDDECFLAAAAGALGVPESAIDWADAPDVTDAGIFAWLFQRHRQRAPSDDEVLRAKTELVALLQQQLAVDRTRFSPIPGACQVFDHLSTAGWRLAIATGCWGTSAHLKLAAAGIPVGTMPLACSDDAPVRAALLRRAIDQAAVENGVGFERIVSIGDGVWDVQAAVAVGVPFVGIGVGERAAALHRAGATVVLPDLADYSALGRALEHAAIPSAQST